MLLDTAEKNWFNTLRKNRLEALQLVSSNDHTETPSMTPEIARVVEQAKQELQRMIDMNPEGMALVEEGGKVVRANRALLDLLGREGYDQVLGQSLDSLFVTEEEDLAATLFSSRTGLFETTMKADEEERHLRFGVIGAASEPALRVLTVRDITEEKAAGTRLEKTHRRETVQQLTGALMHHANQPLTIITVTANLLLMDAEKGAVDPEKLVESLRRIITLATDVAEILKRAENPSDYVTESYMEGLDIMDLERSSGREES